MPHEETKIVNYEDALQAFSEHCSAETIRQVHVAWAYEFNFQAAKLGLEAKAHAPVYEPGAHGMGNDVLVFYANESGWPSLRSKATIMFGFCTLPKDAVHAIAAFCDVMNKGQSA